MRILVIAVLCALPAAGCASFMQGVYDERAEEECEQIVNIDDRRACLAAVLDHPTS